MNINDIKCKYNDRLHYGFFFRFCSGVFMIAEPQTTGDDVSNVCMID